MNRAKANILVIDDEAAIRELLSEILARDGHAVTAVASSREGLQAFDEGCYDLVYTDLAMPETSGWEIASEIKKIDPGAIVVMITGWGIQVDDRNVRENGIDLVISKPFQIREIRESVDMAMELRKGADWHSPDINYTRKMKRELAESNEWLSTILRSIGDAVILTDAEGYVEFMNPVAESLTGWEQHESIGRPLRYIFKATDSESGEPVEDPVSRVVQESGAVGLSDHNLSIAKSGTQMLVDGRAAPVRDGSGNLVGVVLVFHDITESRRMQEEMLRTQKLESIDILAGGIAHDFNNILTAIMGNISLARLYNDPEKISEKLSELEKASMQAKDLIQQLVTFSKGGSPIKKTVSLIGLLRDSPVFALRGSNVKCEFLIPGDLWPVEADPGQISQVISNLVINADQAMPDGGVIKVKAENVAIERDHGLPLENGKYVKISIEDHGVGIPSDHLHKIFDPYFTTKQKGSGLGLATSYSIIKRHDGHITAESQVGVGTTVCVYLPASLEEAPPEKVGKDEGELITGKGKILVMDDEKFIRDITSEMLTSIGYEVAAATDGLEAIRLYKEAEGSKKSYDAVIMDLTVPDGMGGEKAVQELIKIDSGAKVIASSGYSNSPVMADYRKYGFCSVITKPYRIKELSQVLGRIIGDKG